MYDKLSKVAGLFFTYQLSALPSLLFRADKYSKLQNIGAMKVYNLKRINADGIVVNKVHTFQLPEKSSVLDLKTAYAEKRSIFDDGPEKLRLTFKPESATDDEPGNNVC